jgi:hypothetical protein
MELPQAQMQSHIHSPSKYIAEGGPGGWWVGDQNPGTRGQCQGRGYGPGILEVGSQLT